MTDAKAFYVRALPSIDVDAEQGHSRSAASSL
jgi:hypothetical protein